MKCPLNLSGTHTMHPTNITNREVCLGSHIYSWF